MSQKAVLILSSIFIVLVIGFYKFREPGLPTPEKRQKLYIEAKEDAAKAPHWPDTPEELVRQFWEHASRKDWDKLLLYCPGSAKADYILYDRFTPGPAASITSAEPHPEIKDAVIVRATVPFSGTPEKVLPMVLNKGTDGRWFVDGKRTTWW